MTKSEAGRIGGNVTRERYGSEHFRRLQQLSWQRQCELNDKAAFRLSRAGLRSMDPFPSNGAWTPINRT